jgi:PhnB protein
MYVQSYLFFEGRTEEAIEFYKKAVGATVSFMMRWSDSPEPPQPGMIPPGSEQKIMHASFRIGDTEILASDGSCAGKPDFMGVSLAITCKDIPEAERVFKALSEGGQVRQPLIETFFSPRFGMLADKFGVGWMVVVEQKPQ